jgi:hypothetical protein
VRLLPTPFEKGRHDALKACHQDRNDTDNPPAGFESEYGRGWQAGCNEYDAAQLAATAASEPMRLATELPPDMDTAQLTFMILPSDMRHSVEIGVRRVGTDGRVRVEATITPGRAATE